MGKVQDQDQVPAAARSPWADPTACSRCETSLSAHKRRGSARLYCIVVPAYYLVLREVL